MISTDRLLLRALTANDFAALREIGGDSEVLRYRARSQITEEMTREFLQKAHDAAQVEPRDFFAFAVVLRSEEKLIGECGLTVVDSATREAFVWYSFNRHFWNQGYATEALHAMLQVAVSQFGLRRIFAETHPENLASERVMQKVGMVFEGVYEAPDRDGQIRPRLRYAIREIPRPGQ